MMRTNGVWFGRISRVATITLAGICAASPTVRGQATPRLAATQVPATPRPACGTRPPTDMEMAVDAARVADFKTRRGRSSASTLTTITTYVHVIHNGAEGRISERTIRDQMSVLNEAFAAYGFHFEMAPSVQGNPNPDYTDNAAWFGSQDEPGFKAALKEGSASALNIYINSGGGYLGYAYYPTVVGTQYEVFDGVVLAYGTLPDADQPGISDIPGFIYNLGDTGTHEVGHYLGLAHTFQGHCSTYNDGVADTPSERSPDFYCTVGRNSCKDGSGTQLLDPIHNFMDYSDDVCIFEFTRGQSERMNIQWALYREGR